MLTYPVMKNIKYGIEDLGFKVSQQICFAKQHCILTVEKIKNKLTGKKEDLRTGPMTKEESMTEEGVEEILTRT